MALYEFRCRTCDDVFEVRRPMSEAGSPAICPGGHSDTVRLLSMFARTGVAGGGSPATTASGGGCCGGGCGCAR
jgi:putative FmdB family regulatory protein